jgi:hypothetical protein
MDYASGNLLQYYQWEAIQDPGLQLGINWFEDAGEAANMDISSLVSLIRSSNLSSLKSLQIQKDKCLVEAWGNFPIGSKKLSYIHIACSNLLDGQFPLETGNAKSFDWSTLVQGETVYIDPSIVSKINTVGTDHKDYVRYQFFELKMKELPLQNELTNNLLFHFVVLKSEADDFENYLFGRDAGQIKINTALDFMKQYLGNEYNQDAGNLRTDMTAEGTKNMDCSEFVSRFLQQVCGLDNVPAYKTSSMLDLVKSGDGNLEFIAGSDDEDYKDIKPGDVFLWRTSSQGHTGVIVSFNSTNDQVSVIEAIGESGACQESLSKNLDGYCKHCVRNSIYSRTGKSLVGHDGWIGYFRPKVK